jgi:PiT family inorganic phosphate transporter
MGIITALLIAGGILQSKSFAIPMPVIVDAATAIALGDIFRWMENSKNYGFSINRSNSLPRGFVLK